MQRKNEDTRNIYTLNVRTPGGFVLDWEIPAKSITLAIEYADHFCSFLGIEEWEVIRASKLDDDIPF